MLRGTLKSWSGVALIAAVGACSNIIGLSEIDIDPGLDGSGGKSTTGGKSTAGDSVIPEGGMPDGGKSSGGKSSGGAPEAGKSGGGDAGDGAGGEPPSGCQRAADCDDEIDCTVDSCVNGACSHTPDDSVCSGDNCETCRAGIGCVAGQKTTKQLLLDPGFDLSAGDWVDSSSDVPNIVAGADAPSSPNLVKIGPGEANATELQYSDVFQAITIPERTVALSLSLSYRFTPGTKDKADEYVTAALYALDSVKPAKQFHSFDGDEPAQSTWRAVSYNATPSDLLELAGNDYTFDLVGYSWLATYWLDDVQLTATVCE